MANRILLKPFIGELPSRFADRLGLDYAKSVGQEHKKLNGQFFTPVEIAVLMGSFTMKPPKFVYLILVAELLYLLVLYLKTLSLKIKIWNQLFW